MDIEELVQKAKHRGYVEYLELKKALPRGLAESSQLDDIIEMIRELDIEVRVTKAEVITLYPNACR